MDGNRRSVTALAFIRAPALPSVRSPDLKTMDRTDGRAGARMKHKRRRIRITSIRRAIPPVVDAPVLAARHRRACACIALTGRDSLANRLIVARLPKVADRRLEPSFVVHGVSPFTFSEVSLNSPAVSFLKRLAANAR